MSSILSLIWLFVLYMIIIPFTIDFLLGKVSKDSLFNGLSAFAISGVLFIAFSFMNMEFREYEHFDTREIVAVQDSETMIISRYNADSTMYYYYMMKNGDLYKSKKAKQNYSNIRYTDGEPKLEVYKKESTNKLVYFFMPIETYTNDYRYDFYIPKGSIKEEFNIDLN